MPVCYITLSENIIANLDEEVLDIFAFRTNLLIDHSPGNLNLNKEVYAEFEGVNGQRRLEVKQLVCLWDHVRRNLADPAKMTGNIVVAGRPVSLKTKDLRNHYEIECRATDRSRFSGKFFLKKVSAGLNQIDKFRFRSGKVSVSMVQDTSDSINRDFRFKQPFARIVFDNK